MQDQAFRWSISSGHIHIAKWLLSVDPNINISAIHNATNGNKTLDISKLYA